MNWEFQNALLMCSIIIAFSFYHANAKSVAEKLNAINTKSKKQVPYSISRNPSPGIYGGFSSFGSDGQYKRQKVGGWWGRLDGIGGEENLHRNGEDERRDGKWWGRRDEIGDEEVHRYGKDKRQKVGGWWGRLDGIGGEENLHGNGEDERRNGKWWGRRDEIGDEKVHRYGKDKSKKLVDGVDVVLQLAGRKTFNS